MILIRKSWWAALALAAFVGCGREETPPASTTTPETKTPAETSATPSTSGTSATKPEGTPETKSETKPETSKPESAPTDLPAVEGPKIEAPKPSAPKDEDKKDGDKKDGDKKAEAGALTEDEIAEIKNLPAGDQALALKQVVCPVSGEHLGEMGTPVKVTAAGKTFFLCCKGCRKEVNKDPKAVVARLKD